MPTSLRDTADSVIRIAIEEAAKEGLQLYTFALYFDHESPALSVCMDTKENSSVQVTAQNAHGVKYFRRFIDAEDLDQAVLWQANTGRNMSLGDFVKVNVARMDLVQSELSNRDCLCLIQSVLAHETEIRSLAKYPDELVFCCTSPTDEVGVVWTSCA
ncbi:MAG: hypothetical protein AAFX10_01970 [Pseudomonadota bacterium]